METNETYTQSPDYGKGTIISEAKSPNHDSYAQFEQFKAMVCGELVDENKALKKENEELKAEREKHKETITSQAIDISELKKKLEHAQKLLKTAEECKETGVPQPMYEYEYDLSDYEMEAGVKDIENFWNNNYKLTQIKMPNGTYLINNAAAIVPIFLVYTKSLKLTKTKWHYNGTITNFCYYWNQNVATRIEDPQRAKLLTCNAPSLTAEINKVPWKKISPARWRAEADCSTKHKKILNRAANIKERIERMYA